MRSLRIMQGSKTPQLLYITYQDTEYISGNQVIRARLEKKPCPMGLIPDSEDSIMELLDRLRYGGVIIVKRISKPRIDPIKVGLNHSDYVSHYSRPVLVWVGVINDSGRIKALTLDKPWPLGLRSYACQAGALTINQLLEKLGAKARLR